MINIRVEDILNSCNDTLYMYCNFRIYSITSYKFYIYELTNHKFVYETFDNKKLRLLINDINTQNIYLVDKNTSNCYIIKQNSFSIINKNYYNIHNHTSMSKNIKTHNFLPNKFFDLKCFTCGIYLYDFVDTNLSENDVIIKHLIM